MIENNEKRVRQLRREGKPVPRDLETAIALQKSKLIDSSLHTAAGATATAGGGGSGQGQRARTPKVETPQEAFLEEKRLRIEMAGGEEFVYSTDFRSPLPSGVNLTPTGHNNYNPVEDYSNAFAPDTLGDMTFGLESLPGGNSAAAGASGGYNSPGPFPQVGEREREPDTFQNISLEVANNPEAAAAIAAAGMNSRPTTAPTGLDEGQGRGQGQEARGKPVSTGDKEEKLTANEKERLQQLYAHQQHEAQLAAEKRNDDVYSNGFSVPGGSNNDGNSTIVALGANHNYYTGNELPTEVLPSATLNIRNDKGIQGVPGLNDPDGVNALTPDNILLAGSGGAGGNVGAQGLQLVDKNGNPVPLPQAGTLAKDDDDDGTVHPDDAHAVGLHNISGYPDAREGNTGSHVVEVHQIGMLFVSQRLYL